MAGKWLELLKEIAPRVNRGAFLFKGRLILCTVPGSTPKRSAITRTPGRPDLFRASRIRFSSSGGIGGRPSRFPSLLAGAS